MDQPLLPTGLVRAHSRANLLVHVVWATHKRVPVLAADLDSWLAKLLEHKAREIDCSIVAAGNADDHVHIAVRYPPVMAVAAMVHRLKGASSRAIHARVQSIAAFRWQDGYWAESVGPGQLAALVEYIGSQREHHARGRVAEAWAWGLG